MRARSLALLGMAVAGAEGGHLLAYQLRFGAAAQQLQSTGAHTYFPALVKSTVGVAALALIVGLLVVGVARAVSRAQRARTLAGPSFFNLLAGLFTIQLGLFMAQEMIEAVAAGLPADSGSHLLLWGMLGQLPVAILGAAALKWLGTRVESAFAELGSIVPASAPLLLSSPVAIQVFAPERAVARSHSARFAIVKRGPPSSS